MTTIKEHIKRNKDELNNPMISSQRRRHIEDELDSLERYHNNHPEDNYDPTTLELFCDTNPNAPECRVYDV
jgi:hypothetical protein